MLEHIKKQDFWKRVSYFFIFSITVMIIAFIITLLINPSIEGILNYLGERTPESVDEAEGMNKVWEYILNNGLMVPLQMLLLSLIPIPFLYTLNIISTSILPGIALGIGYQISMSDGISITISATPHIIVELFGYAVLAAVLMKLNQSIYRGILNIMSKKKKHRPPFLTAAVNVFSTYIIMVLPIIIIAAFIEEYVSNWIMQLFL